MNWYYSVGQEQKGPVTDEQLQGLAKDGTINAETLVWREGMTEWQAYRLAVGGGAPAGAPAAPTAAGETRCVECGKTFPADQVVMLGGALVCAGCKPKHVQRLQEGVATAGAMNYASFGVRFGAKFIDGILTNIIAAVLGFVIGLVFGKGGPNPALAVMGGLAGFFADVMYKTLFIGALGATPGKMALKLRVVNADGSKVTYGKAFGRALAELLSALTCLIGYIMAGFDDQRRSLHDRVCETRVIKLN